MLLSVFGTNVVVSKGYEGKPALRFGGENNSTVRFRVGCRVYDSNAENNTRWINLSILTCLHLTGHYLILMTAYRVKR